MLDVRLPIGALFFILGIMIAGWGYTHPPAGAIETKMGLLPINFDIVWGWIMTCFGLATFSWARWEALDTQEKLLKASAVAVVPENSSETATKSEAEGKAEAEAASTPEADSESK